MFPIARLSLSATAGPVRGRRFMFDGGPFVIGRAPSCRISIASEGVSRVHARIDYGNGGYWLVPEKTVNGTRLNDALVLQPTQLNANDRIVIHDSVFVVAFADPADPTNVDHVDDRVHARGSEPGLDPIVAELDASLRETRPVIDQQRPSVRWEWWLGGAGGLLVFVAMIVVVTARLVRPELPPAPVAQRVAAAAVDKQPAPAPPPPAPAAPPTPKLTAVVKLDRVNVLADTSGSLVDVAALGALVDRGDAIGHYRDSHAKQVHGHRPVKPIAATLRGTVVQVAVKPSDVVHKNDLVAQIASATVTVPEQAVEGHGDLCAIDLLEQGKTLTGVPVHGDSPGERSLEVQRVPDGLEGGAVGTVRVRCAGSSRDAH